MSKWPMQGHFRYLSFKTFPMTPRTLQCEVFWALLSNSKHLRVPEDSKSPTLGLLGFTPTLGQSGVATQSVRWAKRININNNKKKFGTNIILVVGASLTNIFKLLLPQHLSSFITMFTCNYRIICKQTIINHVYRYKNHYISLLSSNFFSRSQTLF